MANENITDTMEIIKQNYLKAKEAIGAAEILIKFSKTAGNDTTAQENELEKLKMQQRKYKIALSEYGIQVD